MTSERHLNNAPIVEGLIDIRVIPADGISVEKLKAITGLVKEKYPTSQEAMQIATNVQFKVGEPPEQSITSQKVGYRLDAVERKFVLQVRPNSFTVSKLKPYETWENLLAETQALWPIYLELVKPQAITRIATRYINRIELEMAGLDFDDYFSAPPNVPKSLPQVVSEFLSRVVVRDEETNAYIVLTQALEPPNLVSKKIPVIIDIDIFKEASYPVDSNELWDLLDRFRHLKNRAFFDSVTNKTLELFK